MIFFDSGVIDLIKFFGLQKFLNLTFLSSTPLLIFFLSFRTIRPENTSFTCGKNPLTDLMIFFNIQHIFSFRQIIRPSIHNKGMVSGLFLTSSTASFKMLSVDPPGKYFILALLSFDTPFSFIQFNYESPVILTLGFLAGFAFSIVVFFTVSLA